ncbi:hypothetical protein LCGC14_2082780, partial [marine sediment metagenome]
RSPVIVNPDVQANFARLPFKDNIFNLVVFDPPHSFRCSEKLIVKLE